MSSAQAGNEPDYRQLLLELSSVISRYLNVRFGGYDFTEDCVQDILIAVHQARHTYDPSKKFRPWLFAIVRHKTIDAIRKQRVRDNHRANQCIEEEPCSDESGLHATMSGGRLINALSPSHREAITLTKILGYTAAEAASRLNISESAMKVRLHRAISKLRKLLEAEAP